MSGQERPLGRGIRKATLAHLQMVLFSSVFTEEGIFQNTKRPVLISVDPSHNTEQFHIDR